MLVRWHSYIGIRGTTPGMCLQAYFTMVVADALALKGHHAVSTYHADSLVTMVSH